MRHLKKILVLIIGGTILLLGIVFIVLPGPALLLIPLGLGILAIEFSWAKRFLKKAQNVAGSFSSRKWRSAKPQDAPPDKIS